MAGSPARVARNRDKSRACGHLAHSRRGDRAAAGCGVEGAVDASRTARTTSTSRYSSDSLEKDRSTLDRSRIPLPTNPWNGLTRPARPASTYDRLRPPSAMAPTSEGEESPGRARSSIVCGAAVARAELTLFRGSAGRRPAPAGSAARSVAADRSRDWSGTGGPTEAGPSYGS